MSETGLRPNKKWALKEAYVNHKWILYKYQRKYSGGKVFCTVNTVVSHYINNCKKWGALQFLSCKSIWAWEDPKGALAGQWTKKHNK